MKKFFNTAGPVTRPSHYKIDPLHRWDLEEILTLIEQEKYFILHAPRQTGKTSSLLALEEYLNAEGRYAAVYTNVENAQAARNDIGEGMGAILTEMQMRVEQKGFVSEPVNVETFIQEHSATASLNAWLTDISESLERPLVLLIDEIDALVGDTLVSVLRQLRSGYDRRPGAFPSTVILCGVRDIKDYRIHRSNEDIITGGSAFNIKAESLRLGNFSGQDIRELYLQHTEATGQVFTDECFDLVWDYTRGQPWLVNALAHEVTWKMRENRDCSVIITAEKLQEAKERLVVSRQTHLDQLADKLSEERVRRVILPMILGESSSVEKDDEQYCLDLGLIRLGSRGLVISNDIYKEIIPRELTESQQHAFLHQLSPRWLNPDGSLNAGTMITMFREFWRENEEIWASHIAGYQEAAPHLVTQAFLQRVVNGNGSIAREYAAGRGRTDLMLQWRYGADGTRYQKVVMELKVLKKKDSLEKVKALALEQTADYALACSTTEAHILIFDREGSEGWKKAPLTETCRHRDVDISIWGF
jgi:hypothetical protein